jgi:hypothetical protein
MINLNILQSQHGSLGVRKSQGDRVRKVGGHLSQPHFWKSVRMTLTFPKWGLGSPLGLPKLQSSISGSNTSPWRILHIIRKILKCKCRKWPHMSHLDICNTSYGKKKGRESNRQFDSQPLKVRNRPNPDVCKWNATHRYKALKESYKFTLDLIPIGGLSKELWTCKVPRVQTETVSRLLFGSPETKSHSDVGVTKRHREYHMGEGGGFLRIRAVVSLVSLRLPVAYPSTKGAPECELINLLVGLM